MNGQTIYWTKDYGDDSKQLSIEDGNHYLQYVSSTQVLFYMPEDEVSLNYDMGTYQHIDSSTAQYYYYNMIAEFLAHHKLRNFADFSLQELRQERWGYMPNEPNREAYALYSSYINGGCLLAFDSDKGFLAPRIWSSAETEMMFYEVDEAEAELYKYEFASDMLAMINGYLTIQLDYLRGVL